MWSGFFGCAGTADGAAPGRASGLAVAVAGAGGWRSRGVRAGSGCVVLDGATGAVATDEVVSDALAAGVATTPGSLGVGTGFAVVTGGATVVSRGERDV